VAFVRGLSLVGGGGSRGSSAAFLSGLQQALVDGTHQSWEKGFSVLPELSKAYASSHLRYESTHCLQGCVLISSHLFVLPRRSCAAVLKEGRWQWVLSR